MVRSPNQDGESCVTAHVTDLPCDRLDIFHDLLGHGWPKEAQERPDNSRSMLGGAEIGGRGKNRCHPEQDGKPKFKKDSAGHGGE
jgi:hypothetical protein